MSLIECHNVILQHKKVTQKQEKSEVRVQQKPTTT